MELSEIAGIAALILAVAGLIALKIKKKLQERKEEEEEERKEEEISLKAERKTLPPPAKRPVHSYRNAYVPKPEGRTMVLTYNTLLLKDCDHPARVYKADLFQPVYIGRGADNDIRLAEPSVSRKHLRVFKDGALVYAENLSEMNGTYLNGRLLREPVEIVSGNRLKLGLMTLEVEID